MEENKQTVQPGEISLKELILSIQNWISFIISKWKILLLISIIAAVLGIVKSKFTKGAYVAECNFILDEGNNLSKSSGLSSLALLGVGGESEADLFTGKNLIWLYNSSLMIERALLSKVKKDNGKLYIDWFLDIDEEGKKMKSKHAGKLNFNEYAGIDSLGNVERGLLRDAVDRIRTKYLKVETTKNTENIITVTVTAPDELFAALFSNEIIETVNEYYVVTKTQKLSREVSVIQTKVDSFQRLLNYSIQGVASSIDETPYPNPNRIVLAVPSQRKTVDVELSSALFIEMTKNLEAKKMLLASETPLIQVLEKPVLPLKHKKKGLIYSAFIWGITGLGLSIVFFVAVRLYNLVMKGPVDTI